MKPKKSSSHEDELKGIDFTPKSKNEATLNIIQEPDKVKDGVNDLVMAFGKLMSKGLPKLARLQREAREGRDG